jgi:hypothetical protein
MPQDTELLPSVGLVEQTLASLVDALEPLVDPPRAAQRGRPRVLPSLCLWGALVLGVLARDGSQRAIWRRISDLGLWHYRPLAVSDQAIYHRLERDGTAPLQALFAHVTALLARHVTPWTRSELAPGAAGVYVLDETTLDPVARRLGGEGTRRLPGKLAGRFNVRTQLWERLLLTPDPHQNEKILARELLVGIPRGSLILADLGYFAFHWFDELTEAGYWFVSRLRDGTSYELRHVFQQSGESLDAIIWLGRYRADRAAHAVRLVQVRRGQTLHRYLTNVLDPRVLSAEQVVALYARRWDIERAIALVKQHLGLSLWWSTKDVVVHQQLWAVLTIAQFVAALRLEIAGRAGVDPSDVSVALLVAQLPQYAARGWDPIDRFLEVGPRMGYIRPSRRIRICVPDLAVANYQFPPPDLVLVRTPRYAERRSLPRSA